MRVIVFLRGPLNRPLERASHDPALDIPGSAAIASTVRQGPAAIPVIDRKDLALLGLLPVLAALALMLPESAWPQLADRLAGLRLRLRGQRTANEIARIEAVVGDRLPGLSAAACWRGHLANNYLAWLQLLRCHRDRGWRPAVRLEGRARLDAALAAGKGGILWVAPLAFSDLITKLALHEAGYAVSHLSRDTHGFSTTRFGRRLLNPIQTSVERRYLAERLVMSDDHTVGPLRELALRLKSNRLVSITLTPGGQRLRSMRLLDGHLPVATGALTLSWQTGAPVLPVFTLRNGDGGFVTRIEAPLPLDRGEPREIAHRRRADGLCRTARGCGARAPRSVRPALRRDHTRRRLRAQYANSVNTGSTLPCQRPWNRSSSTSAGVRPLSTMTRSAVRNWRSSWPAQSSSERRCRPASASASTSRGEVVHRAAAERRLAARAAAPRRADARAPPASSP